MKKATDKSEELLQRLKDTYDCLNGSMTSNQTPKQQLCEIIIDLEQQLQPFKSKAEKNYNIPYPKL